MEIIENVQDCRNCKHKMVWELAWNGKVQFIISDGQNLLALQSFRGVPVITANESL